MSVAKTLNCHGKKTNFHTWLIFRANCMSAAALMLIWAILWRTMYRIQCITSTSTEKSIDDSVRSMTSCPIGIHITGSRLYTLGPTSADHSYPVTVLAIQISLQVKWILSSPYKILIILATTYCSGNKWSSWKTIILFGLRCLTAWKTWQHLRISISSK